ncbi:MAG: helix-turn-helix domain-containing protein [Pseudomonadales bacterium]|nr:helix-turn-helix domain-containing protein [Pseudomonadales bacterium]
MIILYQLLLNTDQVAELLGIKPHTLAVARCEGSRQLDISFFKVGRSVRYRKAEVEAYLVGRQQGQSRR